MTSSRHEMLFRESCIAKKTCLDKSPESTYRESVTGARFDCSIRYSINFSIETCLLKFSTINSSTNPAKNLRFTILRNSLREFNRAKEQSNCAPGLPDHICRVKANPVSPRCKKSIDRRLFPIQLTSPASYHLALKGRGAWLTIRMRQILYSVIFLCLSRAYAKSIEEKAGKFNKLMSNYNAVIFWIYFWKTIFYSQYAATMSTQGSWLQQRRNTLLNWKTFSTAPTWTSKQRTTKASHLSASPRTRGAIQ